MSVTHDDGVDNAESIAPGALAFVDNVVLHWCVLGVGDVRRNRHDLSVEDAVRAA